MRENLASFLDDWERHGVETAIVHREGLRVVRNSYSDLRQLAIQFSRELEARGVGKGDRVLFWAHNTTEWVAAFFGCVLRGVIAVPLDLESSPDFVTRVQQQVQARLMLTDRQQRSADLKVPVLFLEDLKQTVAQHTTSPVESPSLGASDIAQIIFTSGTTADPKGVCITHRNVLANLAPIEHEIQKYLKWERPFHPIRFLDLLPLSHVFGQFMGIFVPQLLAGETWFQDSLNPSEIIEATRKHRISVIVAVPRMLDSLRHKLERDYAGRGRAASFAAKLGAADKQNFLQRWWAFRDIHRRFGWKFWALVSGGAALSAETELFWRRLGFVVVQGYGMTETASLVSVNHPFKVGRGSIGKALPGQEVKLDERGEILVRGENVSPGYWREGLVALTGEDGWLRTGDVGEMDQQGNLYFKSRAKDVIVTGSGLNIYPEDLESALNAQPEILDSAVVAVETPQGPEAHAFLIPAAANGDLAAAVNKANQNLSRFQHVRRWSVWPEPDFPRTPTRKVRKRELTEWLKRSSGAASKRKGEPSTPDGGLSLVFQQVAGASETIASFDSSAGLATDLKLDSLGRVELLSALEDHYQIDIDEAAFSEATTVADIERIVRAGGSATAEHSYPVWPQRWPVTWVRNVLFYLLLLPLTRLIGRARVVGREHLRGMDGPLLFVSNHVAMVDQSLILGALPARFHRRLAVAMEGEKLWRWRHPPKGTNPFKRVIWLIQYVLVLALINVFPLPQRSGFRRSFAFAGESMDRGFSVLIFPEGRRTPDGVMKQFMEGIGLLTKQLRVPVVPVRIDGLYELKQMNKYFASPGQLTVNIGEPVSFGVDDDPSNITRELERRVSSL